MTTKNEWECIGSKCTHYDGDRCTLGFCEPDIPIEADWADNQCHTGTDPDDVDNINEW